MAEHVFSNFQSLRKLESILHPIIREKERMIIEELEKKAPEVIVVVEIPLLAEGDRAEKYDLVVNVTAPEKIRIDRLVKSGKYNRKEAKDRIANQADNETRASIAHYTVDNGKTMDNTETQVRQILALL
jgi:dephospho-CoA kinase